MGQVLKFPVQASRFDYRRVRKRAHAGEDPDQLHLFPPPAAQILDLGKELGWFEQALLLDERGDSRAAELYRRAIEEGDRAADACCNLGIIESKQGRVAKAFDCFTRALQFDPRHAEAHFNLGNLYFDVEDFRLAQIHYEMGGEVDPRFANLLFNLALVQAINKDFTTAIRTLTRYQALVPEHEGRKADEFLRNLRRSLTMARGTPLGL